MDHQDIITERDLENMLLDETAEPMALPFSLLKRITNGFSYEMEVGRGGFAVVYRGNLEKGVVAVKRLSNTYMFEKEFFREVECLMKVKHRNIARFLGYCVDTQGKMTMHAGKHVMADIQQRLLCFEYLPNGCLDRYINDPSRGLEWTDRYDIIKGICEGLHHLHQKNILHLDLKPANILMDDNMEPKITDFGISRSLEEDQTRFIATKVPGTMGYMAPEFISNLISKKYDLYSLGIVIMEILTGEKTCQGVESVLKRWNGRLNLAQRIQECEQLQVCVEIGIECTDFDPEKRPVDMKDIIERLSETERIENYTPLRHRLYPETGELSSLELTNKTDKHVVYRLLSSDYIVHDVHAYGLVPPRSTCTLIMSSKATIASGDCILQSCLEENIELLSFDENYDYTGFGEEICKKYFHHAKWSGKPVYQARIYMRPEDKLAVDTTPAVMVKRLNCFRAMDAHPTEPWIATQLVEMITIWNYESETDVREIMHEPDLEDSFLIQMFDVKFDASKNWIVAMGLL